MLDQDTLLAFIAVTFGFVLFPGPATLMTAARASSSGIRAGIATAGGIAVGDFLHTVMAVIGISAIIAASAWLFTVIKLLGAGYLIYIGIRAIFDKAPVGELPKVAPLAPGRAFRQAVVAEILNPKTALFFLAFLPQFTVPENGAIWVQLSILGVIFVAMGFLATVIFALLAARLGRFMRANPAVQRWQDRVVGSIYCALGLRLALIER